MRNSTQFCVTLSQLRKKKKKKANGRRGWEQFVGGVLTILSSDRVSSTQGFWTQAYCWAIRACTPRIAAYSLPEVTCRNGDRRKYVEEDRSSHCASGPLYFTRLDKSASHNWKRRHCWLVHRASYFLSRRFSPFMCLSSGSLIRTAFADVKRPIPKLSRILRVVFLFIDQLLALLVLLSPWLNSKVSPRL